MKKSIGFSVLIVAATASPAVAQWQVEYEPDPMTDKINARASVIADGGKLQLMCTEGKGWALAFAPKGYLGRREQGDVWVRIDKGPVKKMRWHYLSTYVTTVNGDQIGEIVGPLMTAQQITIRAKDFRPQSVDVTFDNSGFMKAFVEMSTRYRLTPKAKDQ